VDEAAIVVHHAENAGCYGHTGSDDVAFDAALLAMTMPGTPVQVSWNRRDEFLWEPKGPAMAVRVSATVDGQGQILSWEQDAWGGGHTSRPRAGTEQIRFVGFQESIGSDDGISASDPVKDGGTGRNSRPPYGVANYRVEAHRLRYPGARTSSLRSLGAMMNVLAIESVMDELSATAGVDPIDFRLRRLPDARGADVIRRVRELAGDLPGEDSGRGWGVGYARYKDSSGYCAAIATVTADADIRLDEIFVCADVGRVIDIDGTVNQLEGGAIQAASWTTREQVSIVDGEVRSVDWASYPILSFSEVPNVTVRLLDRPAEPPLGAGEIAMGPVAAAIANAISMATGWRATHLPLTAERIAAEIVSA
jgi:CO/xanthine dehydrogenase Mo-binding subunit